MQRIYKFILRRSFFRGQDRIFNYLFSNNKFGQEPVIVSPLEGNFKVLCDPLTWIGGKIIYTGDYEPSLKKVFQSIIRKGDCVLDVGANIGFHTLYFATLTGKTGNVIAIEPVPANFQKLNNNVKLNNLDHVITHNIALSHKNEQICIQADANSNNPGAYNLFELYGNVPIKCVIGDQVIGNLNVNFIKIDVEGYESFVLDGLIETIKRDKPKIIFEYDRHYQRKTGRSDDYIFNLLSGIGYNFKFIHRNELEEIKNISKLRSGNILALPNV